MMSDINGAKRDDLNKLYRVSLENALEQGNQAITNSMVGNSVADGGNIQNFQKGMKDTWSQAKGAGGENASTLTAERLHQSNQSFQDIMGGQSHLN